MAATRSKPAKTSGALGSHGAPITLPTRPIHMTTDIPSEYILVAFSNPSGLDDPALRPDRWTTRTIGQRLAETGDLFAGALAGDQDLPPLD